MARPSSDKITRVVDQKLDALQKEGIPWQAQWITHAICDDHKQGLAENDDADFWNLCGYIHIRDEVRRRINARTDPQKQMARKNRQPVLAGFDHLQDYYLVKRGDDEIGVPIFQMSDAELDAKADFLDAMAGSCHAHADEIRRFKSWRLTQEAG